LTHFTNSLAGNLGGTFSNLGTNHFTLDECPDLSGNGGVITGGSEGIGFGVAYTLLKHNISKLYIIPAAKDIIDGAKGVIAKELGRDKADRIVWMQCDLSDWRRTKQVAGAIKQDTDRLDILVNNSGRGIMTAQLTDYGVDRHMAVNHMGHAVLTNYLLPLLKETAKRGNIVRISNQSSDGIRELQVTPSLPAWRRSIGTRALTGGMARASWQASCSLGTWTGMSHRTAIRTC
jgi:hypothetical protein